METSAHQVPLTAKSRRMQSFGLDEASGFFDGQTRMGGARTSGATPAAYRSHSRAASLDEQMKDNLAKLQLKLLQQKLESRQKPRSSSSRPAVNSADMRLRNAMKDREKLLAELKMEKMKEDVMGGAGKILQRPYLSTDEYPPLTGIPGTFPPVPFSAMGSRNMNGLEKALALDRRYNFSDVMLNDSLVPKSKHRLGALNYSPQQMFFPPMPPPMHPYHQMHQPPAASSKTSEMMEMMMMQNAQMNQAIMQHMLMSSISATRPSKQQQSESPQVRFLPPGGGFMDPVMGGFPGANSFKLPELFSGGQMPHASAPFTHPAAGPGDFPTQAPAFTVES